MAATHLLYLGVLLLLAMAASSSGAASELGFQRYDAVSPFSTGNTTAIILGNTKSCIAGYGGRMDPYTAYQFCIPSWVAFAGNRTLVGEDAMNHAATSPGTAVSGFKRLLGVRMYNEIVKREAELVPYKLTTQMGRCGIEMEAEEGCVKSFLPERVAGILIAELKRRAEARLGREIRYAVVTVPGHFKDAQKSWLSTEAAQLDGGFRAVKLVSEHVAAAAAYRLHDKKGDGKVVLVFHLGGRTTHVTKFRFKDGWGHLLMERRHDAYLGGEDFTGRVVDYFVELIKEKHHRDILGDEGALRKLRADCEWYKKLLSEREGVLVDIGRVLDEGLDMHEPEPLTRAKFEELTIDLMARAMEMVETVVLGGAPSSQLQSRKDTIDEIILVGGSVRMPMVGQLLEEYFNGRGIIRDEEAVIQGAALLSRPESARYVEECQNGGVLGPFCLARNSKKRRRLGLVSKATTWFGSGLAWLLLLSKIVWP